MRSAWLQARQTRYTAYVTLYILIVIGALGLANWLANRHNKSYDTTSNKRFTLSDQTNKVVAGLKQDVRVTYYDKTDNFPRAKDLLDRYDSLSTKLRVDYVDPDKKPQLARAAGIRNYGTITIDAGPRHEEAKSLTEEEVTGAIIRSVKGGDRTVCAIGGSGEHGLDDTGREGYGNLKASPRAQQLQDAFYLAAREGGSAEGLHRAACRRSAIRLRTGDSDCDQNICRWRRACAVHARCPRYRRQRAGG